MSELLKEAPRGQQQLLLLLLWSAVTAAAVVVGYGEWGRARGGEEGLGKDFALLDEAQKLHLEDRIVPIPGNFAQPLLGLPPDTFKVLANEINAIVHNGADVNLVKLYAALKSVNVLGTQEVLRLAVTNGLEKTRVKPVHYISTGLRDLGSVPDRSDWFFDMTPVDYEARSIVHFAASRPVEALGQTMHIQNPSLPVNSEDFFGYFTAAIASKKLATTAFTEWKRSML
ncbi:hypothetical protein PsorP6_004739 [Peronosclerospora sorghi]|uniref:Uncharacterized protein n=1 Tax=Peronosclerospora sorghi TaxID=230839 RepID=A0ACC0VMY5_9STRA|nr:hypothetical protein PsorP6_004739 [Peronosclerospora sorghi]